MWPFFSVVIPTYNRPQKTLECIHSVLSQTYTNFEIILIDNGSTDETADRVSTIKDVRLNYIYQTGSGSPANPRNTGIRMAKGQWISFLDSDDLWFPEKLERMYEFINSRDNADIICHDVIRRNLLDGKENIVQCGPKSSDMYKTMLLINNRLLTSATSVRNDYIRTKGLKFNEELNYHIVEDYDLWLKIALGKANFYFLNVPLGYYNIDDGNLIGNFELHFKNLSHLLNEHAEKHQTFEKNTSAIKKHINTRLCLILARKSFGEGNWWAFCRYSFQALMSSPIMLLKLIKHRLVYM